MGVKFMEQNRLNGEQWNAYNEWLTFCCINRIPNPFEMLDELRAEYTEYNKLENGAVQVIIHDMSEEQKNRQKELEKYRDWYIEEREFFKGRFLFKNYGYNALSNFAQWHPSQNCTALQEWYRNVRPCEGGDGQCLMFCPIFNECNK